MEVNGKVQVRKVEQSRDRGGEGKREDNMGAVIKL